MNNILDEKIIELDQEFDHKSLVAKEIILETRDFLKMRLYLRALNGRWHEATVMVKKSYFKKIK